jgi:hypothetical protein
MEIATTLPPVVEQLVDLLAGMPGVRAVVLGGSRAGNQFDAGSDWDLGVYYAGSLDTTALAALGTVHAPGAWGRLMNGGAWLRLSGMKIDVMLRDLAVVEHWSARAAEGSFDVDALLGYLAGLPTYSLLAERALCQLLRGTLIPVAGFPPRLAELAAPRWRLHRQFSLEHARMRAARGDVVGAVGHAAKAAVEQAHAVLCEGSTWVLNEKQIIERAGLGHLHDLMLAPTRDAADLLAWVSRVESVLVDGIGAR